MKKALGKINKKWAELRYFAFYNKTVFEILFLFFYTFEQAGLIFIINKEWLSPINAVSYFALIVLFTFGLHKIVMESRIKVLERNLEEMDIERRDMEDRANLIINKYNKLIEDSNKIIKNKA